LASPLYFTIEQRTNENFEVTFPFKWIASQWPLPEGSYFESHIRDYPQANSAVLTFNTNSNPANTAPVPLSYLYDANTTTLYLTFFAPVSNIEPLEKISSYSMDIKLVRTRVGLDNHIDILADGTVKIKEGITRP